MSTSGSSSTYASSPCGSSYSSFPSAPPPKDSSSDNPVYFHLYPSLTSTEPGSSSAGDKFFPPPVSPEFSTTPIRPERITIPEITEKLKTLSGKLKKMSDEHARITQAHLFNSRTNVSWRDAERTTILLLQGLEALSKEKSKLKKECLFYSNELAKRQIENPYSETEIKLTQDLIRKIEEDELSLNLIGSQDDIIKKAFSHIGDVCSEHYGTELRDSFPPVAIINFSALQTTDFPEKLLEMKNLVEKVTRASCKTLEIISIVRKSSDRDIVKSIALKLASELLDIDQQIKEYRTEYYQLVEAYELDRIQNPALYTEKVVETYDNAYDAIKNMLITEETLDKIRAIILRAAFATHKSERPSKDNSDKDNRHKDDGCCIIA